MKDFSFAHTQTWVLLLVVSSHCVSPGYHGDDLSCSEYSPIFTLFFPEGILRTLEWNVQSPGDGPPGLWNLVWPGWMAGGVVCSTKASANLMFSLSSIRLLHPPQQTVRTASGQAACSDSSPIRTKTRQLLLCSNSAGCLAWPNNPLMLKTFYLPLQKLCKNNMYNKYNFLFRKMPRVI